MLANLLFALEFRYDLLLLSIHHIVITCMPICLVKTFVYHILRDSALVTAATVFKWCFGLKTFGPSPIALRELFNLMHIMNLEGSIRHNYKIYQS